VHRRASRAGALTAVLYRYLLSLVERKKIRRATYRNMNREDSIRRSMQKMERRLRENRGQATHTWCVNRIRDSHHEGAYFEAIINLVNEGSIVARRDRAVTYHSVIGGQIMIDGALQDMPHDIIEVEDLRQLFKKKIVRFNNTTNKTSGTHRIVPRSKAIRVDRMSRHTATNGARGHLRTMHTFCIENKSGLFSNVKATTMPSRTPETGQPGSKIIMTMPVQSNASRIRIRGKQIVVVARTRFIEVVGIELPGRIIQIVEINRIVGDYFTVLAVIPFEH